MSEITKQLDSIASEYHLSSEINDKYIEEICQKYACGIIKEYLTSSDRVVELGYGDGITYEELSSFASNYKVIEGSPILVDHALKLHPKISISNALFEEYMPQQKFDAVLALHVFEHVKDPIPLMQKFKEWLRPGGKLITIVPNRESYHRLLALEAGYISKLDELSKRDLTVGHLRVYNRLELEEELVGSGYRIKAVHGLFFKPFSNAQLLGLSHELVGAMNRLSKFMDPENCANLLVVAEK